MTTDILILGAGIGGFETFRTLAKLLKRNGLKKTITIVDQNNYFTFAPLLHEVAAGAVEPGHAAFPLRELVYRTPHKFIRARLEKIIPLEKKALTSAGEITYDFCVVALGSGVNFYGTQGAKTFSYTVRTLTAAMALREALIKKVEGSDNTTAITVVGGGFTGVEVAGQLAHLVKHDLKKLFPEDTITVRLIQNGPTLVPMLPAKAQMLVTKRLAKIGVELLFDAKVSEVKKTSVALGTGELKSDFTIWCAGNENDMSLCIDNAYCERGRMPVTHFLNHPMNASLYGVGDIIRGNNIGQDNISYPQLGEAAHKQGEYVAKHIFATLCNKKIKPFFFKSLGTLMPIGDGYGVVIAGPFIFAGWFAWWIRRTVYLLFMPGILRKLKIMIDWTLRIFGFRYIIDVERNKQ